MGEPFIELKKKLNELGHTLDTIDIYDIDDYDFFIFLEYPENQINLIDKLKKNKKILLLVLLESDIIKPNNYDRNNHQPFDYIFTWKEDLIDNVKYFKINSATKFPQDITVRYKDKKKLCTMIVGNKANNSPKELYSKRLQVLKWFEKKHPEEFDLYGMGWELLIVKNRYLNALFNRIKILRKILARKHICYRGVVSSKSETLSIYKFSICFENAKDTPGYITEKIMDSLKAGCIPIYWGAPNIKDYIDENCFIDYTSFNNNEELYDYIKSLSELEYNEMILNIVNYFNSERAEHFSIETFVDSIINVLQ